ncbi:MAG: 23S rRNA (adenine(2030)-N(6))-methyltransferase RlmJ [Panacagrimonas sp.]
MHYRHHHHAGNFADVFKHILLIGLLDKLNRKSKPWFYLDSHAGAGIYDLHADAARLTGECSRGVDRLKHQPDAGVFMVCRYLETITRLQRETPAAYPGSPAIAAMMARDNDRIVLCESQTDIATQLRVNMKRFDSVQIHQRNGYELSAVLPPAEKRGLILIDPPFEDPRELDKAAAFLTRALHRFANGVYAIWYPIKNKHHVSRFQRQLNPMADNQTLHAELYTGASGDGRMRACGLSVINPPFEFESEAGKALQWLCPILAQGHGARWHLESPAR